MLKTCSKCNSEKNDEEFRLRYYPKRGKSYYVKACKICENVDAKDWRQHNPERAKENERRRSRKPGNRYHRHIKAKYGLSPDDFDLMLLAQGGYCGICDGLMSVTGIDMDSICVDHSHETGEVRFLLHRECNLALGFLRDSSARALAAHHYLERM